MKPGKKAETTLKSEVGNSRKRKISGMFAGGATNLAVWRAMEAEYPQTIKDDSTRAEICKELGIPYMPFDEQEHERLGWAIRQIKGLMLKTEKSIDEEVELFGAGEAKSASDIELVNRKRFLSGVPSLDHLMGKTIFRWLADAPNSDYKLGKKLKRIKGEMVEIDHREWCSGNYKEGDMMPCESLGHQDWKPSGKIWTVQDEKLAYIEKGWPVGWLSLWGGAPGAGKTRLAIAVARALNNLGGDVLYFNGEADEMDFRIWMGSNVDEDLFRVVSGDTIRMADAVEKIYAHKPQVVVFDSLQMLAEVAHGGMNATDRVLSAFKVLKTDEDAGMPHILFISQLNKADELAGSRRIEHLVDTAAMVKKIEGRKKQFLFEIPRKNRGAETGVGLPFEHGPQTVTCVATDSSMRTEPIYKSLQQVNSGAIAEGIVMPE